MSNSEYLWYIPNQVKAGHRGDDNIADGHNSLETLTEQARALEDHGWRGRCSAPAGAGPTPSRSPPHLPPAQKPSNP